MFMKKVGFFFAALGLIPVSAFSGTMGAEREAVPAFFLLAGSGASFANNAHISTNQSNWSGSPNGYNSTLGNTPLYSAGVGYVVNDLLNFDFSYTFRGLYQYEKFQTPGATSSVDPNPLDSARTRYFNLSSNSLLFNATLDGKGLSDRLFYPLGHGFIQPFVGGGLGVSYNTLDNFHTLLNPANYSTSTMLGNTRVSLAYQFNAGLEWQYERIALDLGYRYFNAGNYSSNNYLVTNMNTSGTPVTTTGIAAWSGVLSANEVWVTAKILF